MKDPIITDYMYNCTIVNPDCGPGDFEEAIPMKLKEIETLALVAQEEGFDTWNTKIKEMYMIVIYRHAKEVSALFRAYEEKSVSKRKS